MPEDFINLERVISGKNPRLLKVLPRFIISYLKKVIHQDEINQALREFHDLHGFEFLDSILKKFGVRIHVEGLENLPPVGRYTVVANHPLGGLDGMALMWAAGQVRKDLVFPVNDLLLYIENMKDLFIPINKHGSNAGNVRTIDQTYASEKLILYFPAGLCSRKKKGGICDLEWKKSVVTKSKAHHRDIIPVYIDGRNSEWFYNLSRWRIRLGIKANVEMLYLVDEMFRQKNKDLYIRFGKSVPYTIFDKRMPDLAWSQQLKQHVYRLKHEPNAIFTHDTKTPIQK